MPKPKRIRNLLKSNDQRHLTLIPNDQGHHDDFPEVMSTTPVVHPDESSELPQNEPLELPNQTSSQPAQVGSQTSKRKAGRKSTHYWFVEAIDLEHDTLHERKMTVKDVNDLPEALRIIVRFDEHFSPIGEASELLAGVCGLLATNSLFFPIGFDKWSDMPEDYFNDQWKDLFQMRFCFKRNQEIRKKQIPHTCGAKSLARRRNEWKIETGETIGWGPLWNMTHKRKDGSYVNAKAMEIGEKIDNYVSRSSEAAFEISSKDPVGLIFGKEHSGRVRTLGQGVVPTLAFKRTTTRLSGMSFGSSSGSTSNTDFQQKVATLESQVQALTAYITSKSGSNIPEELAVLFPNLAQQASNMRNEPSTPDDIRGFSAGSNTNASNHQSPNDT